MKRSLGSDLRLGRGDAVLLPGEDVGAVSALKIDFGIQVLKTLNGDRMVLCNLRAIVPGLRNVCVVCRAAGVGAGGEGWWRRVCTRGGGGGVRG